jgi:UDP-galactopyranose mutase
MTISSWGRIFRKRVRPRDAQEGEESPRNRRPEHVGGNCYTEKVEGIQVHKYGPHIFHTNDERIWKYVQKFARFNSYTHRHKVCFGDRIFTLPVNLMTMHQLWGVKTREEAERKLAEVRVPNQDESNIEGYVLSHLGEEIYKTFIYGYTKKQWRREPRDLPASIIRRLPVRLTFDDRYFFDEYQGIPVGVTRPSSRSCWKGSRSGPTSGCTGTGSP